MCHLSVAGYMLCTLLHTIYPVSLFPSSNSLCQSLSTPSTALFSPHAEVEIVRIVIIRISPGLCTAYILMFYPRVRAPQAPALSMWFVISRIEKSGVTLLSRHFPHDLYGLEA